MEREENAMTLRLVLGYIAAGLTFATFLMKNMVPLRAVALASNVSFVAYGYVESLLPVVILHGVLFPLNILRLLEIRKLVRDIEAAAADSPVAQWLLPHMSRRTVAAGTILFSRGDVADEMFYVYSGNVRIVEYGDVLGPGTLIGEVGLFAPDRRRTQSVVCDSDCQLYSLSQDGMYRLYFQNPKLGFHLMRLIVGRLIRDSTARRADSPPALLAGT
jgi:hypothetical protein